ncbi:hypothetical protein E2562_037854 [Oryza meyeriana var. granulata]|uniref:Uncharacterized protein n=1 Tax=Oryza meyeriana var. granulata TaxID=110450 RepID=A0A6G1E856_9ORYZ|nr:hypothetical protein E2562_037854 [Oryza meyeriana var. granulata]
MWFNTVVGMHGKELSSAMMADGPWVGALVAASSPSTKTKVALLPPRLCRQFWKSGDYIVAQCNPDADAPG